MDYEIPVCVRGGAFPYFMEIDVANTSAELTDISIGGRHNDAGSYLVRIPQSTISALSTDVPYSNCIFDTVDSWGPSGVNPGALKFDGNVTREYLAIVNCTFKNFAGTTEVNSGAPIHVMGFKYFLFDNNVAENMGMTSNGVTALVYYKHALSDGTTRRFTAIDSCRFFRGGVYSDDTSSTNAYDMANMELCYNNIENLVDGRGYLGLPGTIGPEDLGPHHIFRNTGQNGNVGIGNSGASTIEIVGNANSTTNSFNVPVTDIDNYDDVADANFNADNTLTDDYLNSIGKERGTVGHEIM